MSLAFVVELPLHEVATNSKADISAHLRYIADVIETRNEMEAFAPFALDPDTVATLDYLGYGVKKVDTE